MDIFVYSDESGVFDKKHNDIFVFGGLIFLSKEEKDIAARKYIKAENAIRASNNYSAADELKASRITNKEKDKLYRAINQYVKFGAIVNQRKVNDSIFNDKKSKQRYLDYVFKISLKNAFKFLIAQNYIIPSEVKNIRVYADEHSTATNGRYELREALEQEFKYGTFNFNYSKFFSPIFSGVASVDLCYCNSGTNHLIRASDITANRFYYCANNKRISNIIKSGNTFIKHFP